MCCYKNTEAHKRTFLFHQTEKDSSPQLRNSLVEWRMHYFSASPMFYNWVKPTPKDIYASGDAFQKTPAPSSNIITFLLWNKTNFSVFLFP